ncbi:uncharacterized protein BDR25DRAFT_355500 [Lindgomyces ingoldianus]|uniref:Uncharacterized protein n=1 Tax=Lindgomyces ingoldianus TaxID=673940 RepID=A0ACB6QTN9_9PLEO|nr:uncharacterized protein BDR25DRAFT_355500 [Lindgomyces ingoldianus]KAF2470389.1 hypothetical protein BDR25DRAFT_355500 [Lindgomyces ingoldianus]
MRIWVPVCFPSFHSRVDSWVWGFVGWGFVMNMFCNFHFWRFLRRILCQFALSPSMDDGFENRIIIIIISSPPLFLPVSVVRVLNVLNPQSLSSRRQIAPTESSFYSTATALNHEMYIWDYQTPKPTLPGCYIFLWSREMAGRLRRKADELREVFFIVTELSELYHLLIFKSHYCLLYLHAA